MAESSQSVAVGTGRTSRGWAIAAGVLLIIVGLEALAAPYIAALFATLLVAWGLVFGGVASVTTAPNSANYETVWDGKASLAATFTDGTSNTILFAERLSRCNGTGDPGGHWWMRGVFRGSTNSPSTGGS